eukprot:1320797-Amphidinium_carterae.2
MEFDTWRNFLQIYQQFHGSELLMPVRTSKDYVGQILRFLLASDTKLSYMEGAVRAHPSEGGIEGTSKAVLSLVGAAFRCLKLCVLRPVSKPLKSGRLVATSVSRTLAESHLTL